MWVVVTPGTKTRNVSRVYGAARAALRVLAPRLHPGSVVRLDEYFQTGADGRSRGWDAHESRAWRETCARRGIEWEPLSWFGGAVTVRVVANAAHRAWLAAWEEQDRGDGGEPGASGELPSPRPTWKLDEEIDGRRVENVT